MITISLLEKPNPTETWLVVLPKEYQSHVSLFAFTLAFLFFHSFPDFFYIPHGCCRKDKS